TAGIASPGTRPSAHAAAGWTDCMRETCGQRQRRGQTGWRSERAYHLISSNKASQPLRTLTSLRTGPTGFGPLTSVSARLSGGFLFLTSAEVVRVLRFPEGSS